MSRDRERSVALALLLLIALLLATFSYTSQVTASADPDTFWHIATGRYVVEHRTIPTVDPFSWWGVENQRPWVPMEWLFDIVLAGVHQGGWAATFAFTAAMAAGFVGVAYALARARGLTRAWAVLVAALMATGTGFYWVTRPQTATFLLVPLLMLLLEKRRYLPGLVLIVAGVNMHGAIWPIYFGVWMLYVIRDRRWAWAPAALLAVLATPQPLETFTYPVKALGDEAVQGLGEYMKTQLWNRPLDLAAYTLVILGTRRRAVRLIEGLAALAIVLMSFAAARMVVWFYIVAVPVLAPYLAAGLEDAAGRALAALRSWRATRDGGQGDSPAADDTAAPAPEAPAPAPDAATGPIEAALRHRLTLAVLFGVLTVLVGFMGLRAAVTPPDPYRDYPATRILDFMRANGMTRAYTSYGEGGYLIYRGFPPMIDGRYDPFAKRFAGDADLMKDHTSTWYVLQPPEAFLRKYRVRWLLLPKNAPLLPILISDSRFAAVMQTDDHILYDFTPLAADLPLPAESGAATTTPAP